MNKGIIDAYRCLLKYNWTAVDYYYAAVRTHANTFYQYGVSNMYLTSSGIRIYEA